VDDEAAGEAHGAGVAGNHDGLHLGQDAASHRHDTDGAAEIDRFDALVDEDAQKSGGGGRGHGGTSPWLVHAVGRAWMIHNTSSPLRPDSPLQLIAVSFGLLHQLSHQASKAIRSTLE